MKDNGVAAIENLMKKKGKFDYILLETTGLADPAPVAGMFWLDEELGSEVRGRLKNYVVAVLQQFKVEIFKEIML